MQALFLYSLYMRRIGVLLAILALYLVPVGASAADVVADQDVFLRGKVTEIVDERVEPISGTEQSHTTQRILVELEGDARGSITLHNDYTPLAVGDSVYIRQSRNTLDGSIAYTVADIYRLPVLWVLFGLFLACLFFFGGLQGVRGLIALALSFFLIGYALLPGLLAGYPPVLIALVVSSLIVVVGSYITHGVNRTTSAAVVGMLCTIGITGALAYMAVDLAHLTGYAQEESVYLRFGAGASIDLAGLLLGGIMIGLLGVLYDIAIGQAIAVEELMRHGKLSAVDAYRRGIRIGREHIGALVNTLAIAYVGASLPLMLLLVSSDLGLPYLLNSEIVAAEIIRTLVGSIGLILAVPITTAIAVYLVRPMREADGEVQHAHAEHRHSARE